MANAIAIVGESGSGKSTSLAQAPDIGIIGLDPTKTFIINIKDKPLPFRGWTKQYIAVPTGSPPTTGNYFASTDTPSILKILQYVGSNRPDIENVVIDDSQYVMSQEFMDNALKTG